MGENVLVAEEIVEETVLNTGFRALAESLSEHLETRVFLVERGKNIGAKIRKKPDCCGWLQHYRLVSSGASMPGFGLGPDPG